MLPEWDRRHEGVMIAWPHGDTDWSYMLDEVDKCYLDMTQAMLTAGLKILIITPEPERVEGLLNDNNIGNSNIRIAKCQTNDTWTRDYGPLAVEELSGVTAVTYRFDGWGLKFAASHDNMAFLNIEHEGHLKADTDIRKGYTLEGGSVESDGKGTILTTTRCMLSINRNGVISREQVEKELHDGLGADRVLWLEYGALEGDDTDSHIDTLARFAPDDTILYVKCYNPEDSHFHELEMMEMNLKQMRTADGAPYNLIGLPLPDPIYDPENGERLPATYANFLITPTVVIMPVYGQKRNDELATQMLRIAFGGREILTVDCRALIRQHGSLHCATMQLPGEWFS